MASLGSIMSVMRWSPNIREPGLDKAMTRKRAAPRRLGPGSLTRRPHGVAHQRDIVFELKWMRLRAYVFRSMVMLFEDTNWRGRPVVPRRRRLVVVAAGQTDALHRRSSTGVLNPRGTRLPCRRRTVRPKTSTSRRHPLTDKVIRADQPHPGNFENSAGWQRQWTPGRSSSVRPEHGREAPSWRGPGIRPTLRSPTFRSER